MKHQGSRRQAKTHNSYRLFAVVGILIVVTVAAFWSLRTHEFVRFDDQLYLTENPHVRNGLTAEGILWSLTSGYASNWHPLTWISHMLDVSMFGLDAGAHHLVSLLFHIVNSTLVFLVFYRLTGMFWQCAILAGIFALHPLHVESVAWASERKDVLSTMFGLLTLGAYTLYVHKRRTKRYLLMIVAFALSLMAKPMFVTLPIALLLLDIWPLRRLSRAQEDSKSPRQKSLKGEKLDLSLMPRLVREKIPLFLLAAVSGVITILVQREGGAVESWDVLPFGTRLSNAVLSYAQYCLKTLWPVDLGVFYPYPGQFLVVPVLGSVVLLAAVSVLAVTRFRYLPHLAVGWLLYLTALVPVIGVIQVGTQAMADRYMYFPIIGLLIMIIWGMSSIEWRSPRRNVALGAVSALTLCALFVLTRQQVAHWANTETIMMHTVSVTEGNWTAHSNLGLLYSGQGRVEEARPHLMEALRIRPEHPESHLNLGNLLRQQGRMDEALTYYREALRIKPDYAEAHNNIGVILFSQGRTDEAIAHYNDALRLTPDLANAHFNLGLALASTGNLADAISHYREALRINPLYAEAHNNLGVAYYTRHDLGNAIQHYQQAVTLQPGNVQAHNNLGIALRETGQTARAIAHFREAIRLAPDYEQARTNLEATLARQQLNETR